ncbi:MAG: hypothetical protein IJV41_00590 [Oscillospiraceae bacterium]|nr:hypothetical protein [Oscillospiraceae bacterium]
MEAFDVTKIVLTAREQAAFDKFGASGRALLTLEEYNALRKKKLVDPSYGWFTEVKEPMDVPLSDEGQMLQAYQMQVRKDERKEDRRYRINTLLSGLALLLSVIAILANIATATNLSRLKRWLGISQESTEPSAPTTAVTETTSSADQSSDNSENPQSEELPAPADKQSATASASTTNNE